MRQGIFDKEAPFGRTPLIRLTMPVETYPEGSNNVAVTVSSADRSIPLNQ
jgi:hypothetical protein